MLTKKILMSLAVLLGLLVIGEAGSRLIWSVSDLSLSPENAHLIDDSTLGSGPERTVSASRARRSGHQRTGAA